MVEYLIDLINWPHEKMHRVECVECVDGYRVFSSFHIFIPSHRSTSHLLCAEHPGLAGTAGAMAKGSIRYSLFAIRWCLRLHSSQICRCMN
jgi:hypothetical protein